MLCHMRLQLPYRGEMGGGGVRSIVPVAKVTPPAVNDCKAEKLMPSFTRFIVRIHVPSIGDSSALAIELIPPMPTANRAKASTSFVAPCFMLFPFLRTAIVVYPFRLEVLHTLVRGERSKIQF